MTNKIISTIEAHFSELQDKTLAKKAIQMLTA